jgi:two-component system sensor histidine kinase KdpD
MLAGTDLPVETRRELLRGIITESRRMGRLIGNLLEMVRLESGALEVQAEWQAVEELVGMARLRVQSQLEHHHVAVDLPPDLPLLRVDGVLIEQVLVNLLENAASHTPAGSTVRIGARPIDGALELTVEDDGPGVPEDELDHLFEAFHRAGNTTMTGSGLGLTIARGIVRAHGGEIEAERSPMGGLRIRIVVPLPTTQPEVEHESS